MSKDNTTQVEDTVPVDQNVDVVSAVNESNVENVQSEPVQPEVTPEQQSTKTKGTSRKKAAKSEVKVNDAVETAHKEEPVQTVRPEIAPFIKLGPNTDAYSIKGNQNIVNQIRASIRKIN